MDITKRPATIIADDISKYYGKEDPELTWSVSDTTPLAFDDDKDEQIKPTLAREEGEKFGTYTIKCTDIISKNYDVTYEEGTFTILKVESGAEFAVEGAKNVSIDKTDEEMLDLTLTDEDRQMVADGAGVRVYFDVAQTTLNDEQKSKILAVAGEGAKIASGYDINLYKKFYHKDAIQLHSVSKPVTFTVGLSSDETTIPDGYTREYSVVTIHDGKAKALDTTVKDSNASFPASEFSIFAVTYVDTPIDKDSEKESENKSTTQKPGKNRTGDTVPVIPMIVLMFISLVSIISIIGKKRKTR